MKKVLISLIISGMAVFLLIACGEEDASDNQGDSSGDDEKLQVVGDFSILSDIVKQVGGDQVDVYNIIPAGEEPHEWDPSPDDTKNTADADAFFYFGWNLEGIEGEQENWVYKLLNAADKDQDDDNVFALSDGLEQKELGGLQENEGTVNPHAFISPKAGIEMAENARDAFVEMDPDNQDVYEENTNDYLEELEDIDQQYEEKIGDIPEEDRIIVTSERAFQYVAEDYGLEEGFIWEIDGNDEGTPDQVKAAIEFVNENEPKALFDEYNGDKRPMETVSNETGVPVAGTLYSGDLGTAETYVDYLKHNLQTILNGIAQDPEED
ncbi:zinc ABC transporter substrate-binding protein [Virgibacillus sp. NKC19-3]|uniref:metal ABC transporter solute-binding protein, Zn/Mn family n=1 Tax=Virgibacillus saliphilus TaxID=2831674 RepID=UPI001C9B8A6F|nr:zinc ABC transporter substrate-binding protein [Virgibacillus sp. NKC19-3]MBY7144171.1 zinc ABC transporter substrate-binding protein [Virgibacillus sp. NKC19-3]